MIVEFECTAEECGAVEEHYYPTHGAMPREKYCSTCRSIMKRLWGAGFIRVGGRDAPGYEKVNEDMLTLGKAIDAKQRWV